MFGEILSIVGTGCNRLERKGNEFIAIRLIKPAKEMRVEKERAAVIFVRRDAGLYNCTNGAMSNGKQ